MALTWGDWLRFVLIPLLVAAITAIVATRNAKKTPHERLKNLVDIHKNMPENLDSRKVVEGAIARELVDFDRRVAADQRGWWAGVRERLAQLPKWVAYCAGIGILGYSYAAVMVVKNIDDWPPYKTWSVCVFAVVGAVASVRFGIVLGRDERKSLKRDRAVADIVAHFSRMFMQDISEDGGYVLRGNSYANSSVADRLVDMGVLEPVDATSPDDAGFSRFVLTEFGREVWDSALAEAERQHIAKWEDIANERGEGDHDPGRSAPGA